MERLRTKNCNRNSVSAIKEGMNLAGLPAGVVREPLGKLDEADRQELIQILRSWGKLERSVSRGKGSVS
jgi:4-hydroxy-tetrahydrodipicolinate synthase